MAAVAIESWHQPNNFAATRPHLQYAHPQPQIMPPDIPIPPRNEKELSREFLVTILNHFATLIPSHFNGHPLRLVVHGGACMLLHPGLSSLAKEQHYLATNSPSSSPHNTLPRRMSTRDVDYIHRSFVTEWQALGIMDPGERIRNCIKLTAQQFQLGADWMNSDADVALPMVPDATGTLYDPIYHGALKPNNLHLHTIFTSSNGMLTLISVPPVWSIALKLMRYTKYDPGDICLLLRNGTNLNNTHWTVETLELWLGKEAAPMNYHLWAEPKMQERQARIQHAIHMVNNWDAETARGPVIPANPNPTSDSANWPGRSHSRMALPAPPPSQHPGGPHPGRWSVPPLGSQMSRDDRWMASQPQHAPSPAHTPWHPKFETEVQKLDRDIASMMQASMTVPLGALPGLAEKTSRKIRDKKRVKSRQKDRRSKWSVITRYFDSSDSETDEDAEVEVGGERRRRREERPVIPHSQGYPQGQAGQPFLPRPSAWMIYAPPPAGTVPQHASTPYHIGQPRLLASTPHNSDQRPSTSITYPTDQRRASTSTPYIPDQRQSSTSSPYITDQRQSSTITPYIPEQRRSSTTAPYIPDQRRSSMTAPYIPDQMRSSTTTPYIPDQPRPATSTPYPPEPHRSTPYPVDQRRSSTPYHPEEHQRMSTPYLPEPQRSRSSTPFHPTPRSRSHSPAVRERRRPTPLELSPINQLLVF